MTVLSNCNIAQENNGATPVSVAQRRQRETARHKKAVGKAHALPTVMKCYFRILCMKRLFLHGLNALALLLAAERQVSHGGCDED